MRIGEPGACRLLENEGLTGSGAVRESVRRPFCIGQPGSLDCAS